jgi:endonuclease-3 related protein
VLLIPEETKEKVIFMDLMEIYKSFSRYYLKIEPHHDTWMLWLKNKSQKEVYEVAVGTILVQNTNWKNVDSAIKNLFTEGIDSFIKLEKIDIVKLEEVIQPAGFYKQKARYLISLAVLFNKLSLTNRDFPTRNELLEVKGIGRETADSILVYCFYQPFPIIGTYTRRFLTRLYADPLFLKMKYEKIQELIKIQFPDDYIILGTFHALIVTHCKNFCQKNKTRCEDCFLSFLCIYGSNYKSDPSVANIQGKISSSKKKK